MISRQQYRKIMQEYLKTRNKSSSSLMAGVDIKTARKYIRLGYHIDEPKAERHWRTRQDPFEDVWPELERLLSEHPELQAKSLLDELLRRYPGDYNMGQLRSLQRRLKAWKNANGIVTPKPIYFEQIHHAGECLQIDWFHPKSFSVTVGGKSFKHLLCHTVLTYSNWESIKPCYSESFISLKSGLQKAIGELDKLPMKVQTDNSSAATHKLSRDGKKRGFNERFLSLMEHYGLSAKTINVGAANENGDVESSNGHSRNYLADCLALRGSSDFESIQSYEDFIDEMISRRNRSREAKLQEELSVMRPLNVPILPDYEEHLCHVNKYGFVSVGKGTYSIPAKYRHRDLRARVYERQIDIYDEQVHVARFESCWNDPGAHIDYRHLITDLCRKPGAFSNYRYKTWFFPGLVWRECYDWLQDHFSVRRADTEYLHLLELSIAEDKQRLERLLNQMLKDENLSLDRVRNELGQQNNWRYADMTLNADLSCYDNLLSAEVKHG